MKRDFLSLYDISNIELVSILESAAALKKHAHQGTLLAGKTAALIFEKPSLRTRVSFEIAIYRLGGHSVFLEKDTIKLGERESIDNVAKTLSGYCDIIIARVFKHVTLEELSKKASIPVINALSDLSHPCQILSDLATLNMRGMLSTHTKIVYIGDGNNIANAWLEATTRHPINLTIIHPKGYGPDPKRIETASSCNLSHTEITSDISAIKDANIIYTDVWASMGNESESQSRKKKFQPYQVNENLLRNAKENALIMHCLPAHEGEEITGNVLRSPQSIVFEQAENRLYTQQALIMNLCQ